MSKPLTEVHDWNDILAGLIEEGMNSEDDIDSSYLLEAVVKDLKEKNFTNVAELLRNPIS